MFKLKGFKGIRVAWTGSLANARGVNADNFMHEADASGYGAKRAAALARDLADCEALSAIEAKDGEESRRVRDAG